MLLFPFLVACALLSLTLPSQLVAAPSRHLALAADRKTSNTTSVKRFSLVVSQKTVTFGGQSVLVTVFNNSYPGPPMRLRVGESELLPRKNSP